MDQTSTPTSLSTLHLRRELRTAIELGIVALAPEELVGNLAASAGYLEALESLPHDSAPVAAQFRTVLERAATALKDWRRWHAEHIGKVGA